MTDDKYIMTTFYSCQIPSFSSILSIFWDIPGGPVAKTSCSQCRGPGLIPGQGTRSHMLQVRVHMLQLSIFFENMDTSSTKNLSACKNG